jgi:hypothetical protein
LIPAELNSTIRDDSEIRPLDGLAANKGNKELLTLPLWR